MIDYDPKKRLKVLFALQGTVIPSILDYIAFVAAWSALVVLVEQSLGLSVSFGTTAHTIVGLALGLLLVFRTNTAYDRYWEGRQQLEQLGCAARNFAIRAQSVVPREEVEYRQLLARLLVGYVFAVKEYLRDGIRPEHLQPLPEEARQRALRFSNPANGILSLLSDESRRLVKESWIAPPEYNAFAGDITQFQASLRALERIRMTPIPFAYVNQLKVFMLLYFLTLPFALAANFGWGTVVAVVFIAYALVGIEEIGVEIEDPFGDDPNDLPTDALCLSIQHDVEEVLEVAK